MIDAPSSIILDVKNLCKNYHSPSGTLNILHDVCLEVHQGEFLAIMGESGSGKSTLLQLLGTLDSIDSGDIKLQGISILSLSENKQAALRNRSISFVYQEHHLIPELTAVENVMLPLLIQGESKQDAKVRSEQILIRLNLQERLQHPPTRLSGGEAQRVAVARALVTKPALLLADEPTGNLDEDSAQIVFKSMQALCYEEGTSIIMVTHSPILAAQSHRMLQLHHGQLISIQHPEEKL
ncbi:MAG: ABC transporter ATP-binding protein [Mariprofundaceae bacterium]|nr:ABC transporter ATP-binding protein [Mariprofundaceae bacterium]